MVTPSARRSQGRRKTGSSRSITTGPKPSMPPRSWMPSTAAKTTTSPQDESSRAVMGQEQALPGVSSPDYLHGNLEATGGAWRRQAGAPRKAARGPGQARLGTGGTPGRPLRAAALPEGSSVGPSAPAAGSPAATS
jgi:hypothetical protein